MWGRWARGLTNSILPISYIPVTTNHPKIFFDFSPQKRGWTRARASMSKAEAERDPQPTNGPAPSHDSQPSHGPAPALGVLAPCLSPTWQPPPDVVLHPMADSQLYVRIGRQESERRELPAREDLPPFAPDDLWGVMLDLDAVRTAAPRTIYGALAEALHYPHADSSGGTSTAEILQSAVEKKYLDKQKPTHKKDKDKLPLCNLLKCVARMYPNGTPFEFYVFNAQSRCFVHRISSDRKDRNEEDDTVVTTNVPPFPVHCCLWTADNGRSWFTLHPNVKHSAFRVGSEGGAPASTDRNSPRGSARRWFEEGETTARVFSSDQCRLCGYLSPEEQLQIQNNYYPGRPLSIPKPAVTDEAHAEKEKSEEVVKKDTDTDAKAKKKEEEEEEEPPPPPFTGTLYPSVTVGAVGCLPMTKAGLNALFSRNRLHFAGTLVFSLALLAMSVTLYVSVDKHFTICCHGLHSGSNSNNTNSTTAPIEMTSNDTTDWCVWFQDTSLLHAEECSNVVCSPDGEVMSDAPRAFMQGNVLCIGAALIIIIALAVGEVAAAFGVNFFLMAALAVRSDRQRVWKVVWGAQCVMGILLVLVAVRVVVVLSNEHIAVPCSHIEDAYQSVCSSLYRHCDLELSATLEKPGMLLGLSIALLVVSACHLAVAFLWPAPAEEAVNKVVIAKPDTGTFRVGLFAPDGMDEADIKRLHDQILEDSEKNAARLKKSAVALCTPVEIIKPRKVAFDRAKAKEALLATSSYKISVHKVQPEVLHYQAIEDSSTRHLSRYDVRCIDEVAQRVIRDGGAPLSQEVAPKGRNYCRYSRGHTNRGSHGGSGAEVPLRISGSVILTVFFGVRDMSCKRRRRKRKNRNSLV